MNLPLYRSPGTTAFLDDDADFLEMMALVVPPRWPLRLFLRPSDFIAQLRAQHALREADHWRQQEIVDRWRKICTPLIPQVLQYWADGAERYRLVRVAVVDYSMPAMDGIQTLRALDGWLGTSVLLTGRADEQLAVNAFNDGVIQQFIAKQASDMVSRLVDSLDRLHAAATARTAAVWRSTLTPRQHALLSYPSIARDLAQWTERHWVEHVVIGSPFGVLGRDAAGRAGWLQLEPVSGLDELAELAETGVTSSVSLDEIRQGRQLAAVELVQVLGPGTPVQLSTAFPVGDDEPLLAALFAIDDGHCDRSNSLENLLARLPARQVER